MTGSGRRLPLLIPGLVLIAVTAVGIAHFVLSAGSARFPPVMFGANRNWIFIGIHALLGIAGLTLTGLSSGRRAPRPERAPLPPSE